MEYRSFLLRINFKDAEDYLKRHQQVYPELEEQFRLAGIQSYHIYYHEGILFAHMCVENFDKAMTQIGSHPANLKWQAFMSDMLIPWGNRENIKMIPNMYTFLKS
jgi:L-rhamnose mutarotase